MSIPLHLRLTVFYGFILALALWSFGTLVYSQAEQRAYHDLDNALSSRAASVRLGKDIFMPGAFHESTASPLILPSVDGLGTGGIAIEVLDDQLNELATTTGQLPGGTTVADLRSAPALWDAGAARSILQKAKGNTSGQTMGMYSTVTYQDQYIRVYTLLNRDFDNQHPHIIQTARSEADIEQSLSDLRLLLLRGAILVLFLALGGGWLMTWSVLSTVRRMTRTTQAISDSRDFSKRVPATSSSGQDELAHLASTFNQMLANLEESYQRQRRFVADASHELRAPITSIRCNLDLLARAPDLPPAEAQAALTDARAEAERMGRLVNHLLFLARADDTAPANSTSLSYGYKNSNIYTQLVDLDSLLLDVFRQYRVLDEHEDGQRAGPRLLLHSTTPAQVYGDADQLKQALVALVDNALKYTPQEGYVSLSLHVNDSHAIGQVSDTGIGILPEDLPHIFERFYRADRARTRDHGGSGLGLAIAQSIVQQHQGTIEVESTPGKGSTFTLKLPLASDPEADGGRA